MKLDHVALRTWGTFCLLLAGLAALFTVDGLGGESAAAALPSALVLLVLGAGLLLVGLRRRPGGADHG